jgi:hypothetical protein
MTQATDYTQLITSEHNQRPNFVATVTAFIQAFVDLQNVYATFAAIFDLGTPPVGDQLDKIGAWVGANRNLSQEVDGTSVLDDVHFLLLIKLVIASNHWNGTIPGAEALWNAIFAADGIQLVIQDHPDMTMAVIFLFTSGIPDDLTLAILTNGYFQLIPAGVRVTGYYEPYPPESTKPMFAFDVNNSLMAGWDTGYWAQEIS